MAAGDWWLYVLRFATGAAAAGVIPIALAYVGDAVPYHERQAALGRIISAGRGDDTHSDS